MAAGIHVAKEHFPHGDSAFLAQIPGLENGGRAAFPGAHAHARAAVIDDDDMAIELGNRVDQILLNVGQLERTIPAFALDPAVQSDTNDDGIGVGGCGKVGNLRRDQGHSHQPRPPRPPPNPPPNPPRPAGALASARS